MNYSTWIQIWVVIIMIGLIVWKNKWRRVFLSWVKETIGYVNRINRIKDRWMETRIHEYAENVRNRYPGHLKPWEKFFAPLIVRKVTKTVANLITAIRVLLAAIILLLLLLHYYAEGTAALTLVMLGLFLFIIAGLLDLLDGPTARALNEVSDIGKWLDPLADKLLLASAFLILGFAYLKPWLYFMVIGQELFLIIISLIKMMLKRLPFTMAAQANLAGKIKNIAELFGGGLLFLRPLDEIFGTIAGAFFIISIPLALGSIIGYLSSIKLVRR